LRIVADIETNGLDDATRIWCVCAIDVDTKKEYTFDFTDSNQVEAFKSFVPGVRQWIGHNFIAYDGPWLYQLAGISIEPGSICDTLVLSHLLKYRYDDGEGHSLEAWGTRLGIAKVGLDLDFKDQSSIDKIIERCQQDVKINLRLYEFLMTKLDRKEFAEAIETEMQFAVLCRDMHDNGFAFDYDGAKELYNEIEKKVSELDSQIKAAFPPIPRPIREITPKLTKHGTISRSNLPRDWLDFSDITDGSSFTLIRWEEFNPSSTKQIIDRLSPYWKPTDRTDGYLRAQKERDKEKLDRLEHTAWKVNEANLSTVSEAAPQATKFLVRRLMLGARLRTLTEWMEAYSPTTGRVHGRFNGIGTWTHRMSHKSPNLGNVAAEKSIKYNSPDLKEEATKIGGRMRSFWRASEGSYLVGTDMESAHLRIFAHLIDDNNFKEALLKGDKKLGTDPHSVNARLLESLGADRDRAKTFIFTFLNGGGVGKVASIFGATFERAKESLERFIESYPGLKRFKDKDAKAWAKRGYFVGPDGRFVVNDSDHHMLAGYLQNYEAVIVKKTVIESIKKFKQEGLSHLLVNVVHDEVLFECPDAVQAKRVGDIVARTFVEVGELYKMRIPIAGEYKIGKNWLEAH
jgi:DNA polymerase-1